jgi:hypothetical protein
MYDDVSLCDFEDRFNKMGRGNQFSYDGKIALFEYLEDLEDQFGEPIKFDCIALCCEYTEFENLAEYNDAYSQDFEDIDEVGNETVVIRIDNSDSFIIQQY